MSTPESNAVSRVENPFGAAPVVAGPSASAAALAGREVAEIQAGMVIAQRFPRDPRKALDRILTNCQRIGLAEDAVYEYARGGTQVTGASIRLAEELARSWGNVWSGVTELARVGNVSEVLTFCWDLETGYRDEKRFQVRHWRDTRSGGHAITEERDIYELIANMGARRKRACILAVIPSDVQEAALQQCEETLKAKVDVTPGALKTMLDWFGKFGVTKEMIEKRIQRNLESMQPAQLLGLRRVYNSLKDGMSQPADWFDVGAAADPAATPQTKTQTEAAKETLRGKKAEAAGAKPAADEKLPHHDAKSAIAAIRGATTLKALEDLYGPIVQDFVGTNRGVPQEVEGAYTDRKAALEQEEV